MHQQCNSTHQLWLNQIEDRRYRRYRSIEGSKIEDRRIEGPKSRRFVRHTLHTLQCDHGRSAWRRQKKIFRSHSSPRKLSTYGPLRRRPRARRADRTAGTIAAVLPPVETAPIGEKSVGGPPRTAAVAPSPILVLPSIFLVVIKVHDAGP